ncbi:MAG: 1-(5-phosphoribosyl)-5-[(5-phosphoribosylamino)methylideneamino] imidazole-4-carboxamide isomerase [Turneriella sp.]|nr:1-(5-phosphoribosyl)-5-[(5-phosphoribosylamino)methylideneamino] imidazole-4-carboxamide isomerase [Leptospiraceae bacterium]MCX7632319.1 1-(5-phosphoribosyl)-5-[(5-phosphoribosylamino)methylideneamino] imidazole-4-carboxamide isomerase [Turneriella sp.]
MKLIPALDILDGKVVRLRQGNYNEVTVYSEKPIDLAWYLADHGAERLHLVDLRGAKEGKICAGRLFCEIRRSVNIPCQAGGGIRSLEDCTFYFDHGFEPGKDFLILGSLPFVDPDTFAKILEKWQKAIFISADVLGKTVRHSGWLKDSGTEITAFMDLLQKKGVENFLVTQIARDGMLEGPDFALYEMLLQRFPKIQLVASGGISSIEDLRKLRALPLEGVIIGRAFYEGKITAEMMRDFRLGQS